jgi:hypothetical protein
MVQTGPSSSLVCDAASMPNTMQQAWKACSPMQNMQCSPSSVAVANCSSVCQGVEWCDITRCSAQRLGFARCNVSTTALLSTAKVCTVSDGPLAHCVRPLDSLPAGYRVLTGPLYPILVHKCFFKCKPRAYGEPKQLNYIRSKHIGVLSAPAVTL